MPRAQPPMKVGIFSCAHPDDLSVSKAALDVLLSKNVDMLVLNGVLGEPGKLDPVEQVDAILRHAGASRTLTAIIPGSGDIAKVLASVYELEKQYPGLVYTLHAGRIRNCGYAFNFLPGGRHPTTISEGKNFNLDDEEKPRGFIDELTNEISYFTNPSMLRKFAKKDNILFSFMPRKFKGEHAIDAVRYGEVEEDFQYGVNGHTITYEQGRILPVDFASELANLEFPVSLYDENEGYASLGSVMNELGLRAQIVGCFSPGCSDGAVHRAHDSDEQPIGEMTYVKELYWMPSCVAHYKVGILHLNNGLMAVENIDFSRPMKKTPSIELMVN